MLPAAHVLGFSGKETVHIRMYVSRGFPRDSAVKDLPTVREMQETRVQSSSQEDPPEEGKATHSSILAWRIPWTDETGRLQSIRL